VKKFKFVYYLCAIAMVISLGNVFINGNFPIEGPALLTNNWGIMSVVDLFAGIIVFSTWIVFREKNKLVIAVLLVLMVFFGFLTASLYILVHLYKAKGDWAEFFFGSRRQEIVEKLMMTKK
jgi:magnesium-transporting ATPase (P-type)